MSKARHGKEGHFGRSAMPVRWLMLGVVAASADPRASSAQSPISKEQEKESVSAVTAFYQHRASINDVLRINPQIGSGFQRTEILRRRMAPCALPVAMEVAKFVRGEITLAQLEWRGRDLLYDFAEEAYALFSAGKVADAIPVWEALVTYNPYDAYFHSALGACYQRQKHFDEAITQYTLAIKFDPRAITALANRGETFMLLGRKTEAANDFRAAIDLDPNMKDEWAMRAREYLPRVSDEAGPTKKAKAVDPANATTSFAARLGVERRDESTAPASVRPTTAAPVAMTQRVEEFLASAQPTSKTAQDAATLSHQLRAYAQDDPAGAMQLLRRTLIGLGHFDAQSLLNFYQFGMKQALAGPCHDIGLFGSNDDAPQYLSEGLGHLRRALQAAQDERWNDAADAFWKASVSVHGLSVSQCYPAQSQVLYAALLTSDAAASAAAGKFAYAADGCARAAGECNWNNGQASIRTLANLIHGLRGSALDGGNEGFSGQVPALDPGAGAVQSYHNSFMQNQMWPHNR